MFDPLEFWEENARCEGKPFLTSKPRAPLRLPVDDHWLLEEMALPSTVRYYEDAAYRLEVHGACNDRCEGEIGLRPFSESFEVPPVRIERILGCRVELTEGGTPWLEPGIESAEALEDQLRWVEALSDAELLKLIQADGAAADDAGGATTTPWSRGPFTIATSVLGTMRALEWVIDEPHLMERFFDVLAQLLIRYHRVWASANGRKVQGFAWLDDNCALLSPDLYERFALPVMQRVFAAFATEPGDTRFQHSDSAMGHLLPLLAQLKLTGVNFGPTLLASDIRRAMPRAEIHGQLAPFTLRSGDRQTIAAEVRRDFRAVGQDGGLVITTAGSIAAGTSLPTLRWLMEFVAEHCRYDR